MNNKNTHLIKKSTTFHIPNPSTIHRKNLQFYDYNVLLSAGKIGKMNATSFKYFLFVNSSGEVNSNAPKLSKIIFNTISSRLLQVPDYNRTEFNPSILKCIKKIEIDSLLFACEVIFKKNRRRLRQKINNTTIPFIEKNITKNLQSGFLLAPVKEWESSLEKQFNELNTQLKNLQNINERLPKTDLISLVEKLDTYLQMIEVLLQAIREPITAKKKEDHTIERKEYQSDSGEGEIGPCIITIKIKDQKFII